MSVTLYRTCPQCGDSFPADPMYFYQSSSMARQGRFEYCTSYGNDCHARYHRSRRQIRLEHASYGLATASSTSETAVETLPSVPARLFGVELEFTGRDFQYVNLRRRMPDLDTASYSQSPNAAQWTFKYEHCGNEVISPPLQANANGFDQVETACTAIKECGGRVSSSCGLHVHIDVRDLSLDEIKRVVSAWVKFQPEIDGMVSRRRRQWGSSSQWCGRFSTAGQVMVDQASTIEELKSQFKYVDRYRSLNLAAFAKHGTMEFRLHQGDLNHKNIVAWVKFLVAFIEAAKSDSLSDKDSALDSLFDALNTNVPSVFDGRTSSAWKRRIRGRRLAAA